MLLQAQSLPSCGFKFIFCGVVWPWPMDGRPQCNFGASPGCASYLSTTGWGLLLGGALKVQQQVAAGDSQPATADVLIAEAQALSH